MKNHDGREIVISPQTIFAWLAAIITFLLVVNLFIIYLNFIKGYQHIRGFIRGFYFDGEANFPSLYSALAIFLGAALLWKIGSSETERKRSRSFFWKFLSVVFIFLSIDEFASLHEYLIGPMKVIMERLSIKSNYFYFAWFIPYGGLVLLVGILSIKFLSNLPSRTRGLFILAGIIFLCGALVMEMIGGRYWAEQGWSIEGTEQVDLHYALITTLEEFLEMVGIAVFVYALCAYYLRGNGSGGTLILIRFTDRKENT